MNTIQKSLSEKQLIWDWPIRIFHWLLVLCFAGAWLTAESERWRLIHVTFGYTMIGLLVFRLLWGVIGTRHARFASFLRGPSAVLSYARSLFTRRPQHYAGHNPLGALAIIGFVALISLTAASGHFAYTNTTAEWAEEMHETTATVLLAIVVLHIVGVTVSSFLHRENLIAAMFTGRKNAAPGSAIRWSFSWLGALMLAAVLGFWWMQWRNTPRITTAGSTPLVIEDRYVKED